MGLILNRNMTPREMANLIERFLENTSLYPQEWNDLVETSQKSEEMDWHRRRCYELDPLVNSPARPDDGAVRELRVIVSELMKEHSSPYSPGREG